MSWTQLSDKHFHFLSFHIMDVPQVDFFFLFTSWNIYVGYFQFLAITNKTTLNIYV